MSLSLAAINHDFPCLSQTAGDHAQALDEGSSEMEVDPKLRKMIQVDLDSRVKEDAKKKRAATEAGIEPDEWRMEGAEGMNEARRPRADAFREGPEAVQVDEDESRSVLMSQCTPISEHPTDQEDSDPA